MSVPITYRQKMDFGKWSVFQNTVTICFKTIKFVTVIRGNNKSILLSILDDFLSTTQRHNR